MLDETKKLISLDELAINNEEFKKYIKEQVVGLTVEDVRNIINELDTNTTYTLTKNENNEIVLTGSDGSVMTISDTDTKTNNEVFSNIKPSYQNIGDVWTELL